VGTGYDGSYKNDFWEYNPIADTWTQKAAFGGIARNHAAGFSIADKGYIGTGYNNGTYYKDFWQYNPGSNTWAQKANLTATRYDASAFSIGSKGYIGMGYNGNYKNDFWEYRPAPSILVKFNPTSAVCPGGTINVPFEVGGIFGACEANAFTVQLSNANGSFVSPTTIGTLAGSQSATIVCTIPGATPVGTGYRIRIVSSSPVVTSSNNGSNIEIGMVASNVWKQKANFVNGGRERPIGFSIGTKAYVGLGEDGSSAMKDFWEYDSGTNTWIQKADFPGAARYSAVSFSIGTKGYVGTGESIGGTNYYKDFWEYDPATNVWTRKADFPGVARHGAIGFSINSTGYVGTGSDGAVFLRDFYKYDPNTDSWWTLPDFGGTARVCAVGFTIGNKGYVGTGYDGNFKQDFWMFDPNNYSWIQKANFGGNPRYKACGFGIGTEGFIGMGYDNSNYYNAFWEYSSTNDSWVQKAQLGGNPRLGAVGFSIGPKGYIGMGYDNSGAYKNDFWVYEPTPTILTKSITYNYIYTTCAGSSLNVSFGVSGTFGLCSSNTFKVQLSDATGSFSSPTVIGSITGTTDGTIPCTFPANAQYGSKYRIRVVSTNPVVTGTNNGVNIKINIFFFSN
ncbi:MAG: kelch repeat-containing protein, partial [Bacteroidota bacterium]